MGAGPPERQCSPLPRLWVCWSARWVVGSAMTLLVVAGVDPGSGCGGRGASRAMPVAALAEPTLLLAVFAISGRAGSSNLGAIVAATLDAPRTVMSVQSLLALVALAIAALAECARLP